MKARACEDGGGTQPPPARRGALVRGRVPQDRGISVSTTAPAGEVLRHPAPTPGGRSGAGRPSGTPALSFWRNDQMAGESLHQFDAALCSNALDNVRLHGLPRV